MDIEYSLEPIGIEDLRIFVNKGIECIQFNKDRLWECLQSSTDRKLANLNSVQLMDLVQGGGLHYAVTHGFAKRYLHSKGNGLKDIDIYVFFKRQTGKENYKIRDKDGKSDILRWDLGPSKFGRCPDEEDEGRRIDVIPYSIKEFDDIANPFDAVKQWLERGWNIIKGIDLVGCDKETVNKFIKGATEKQNEVDREYHPQFIASKAVVAIYPEEYFGKILWGKPRVEKINNGVHPHFA